MRCFVQTYRERVGGGFVIRARDPLSKHRIGMDRYLKRYPLETRHVELRVRTSP
jgi:hypothetical protein